MKVRPTSEAFQPFQRVSEKQDKDGFSGQSRDQSQDRREKGQGEEIAPTFSEVSSAIESFTEDKNARENGLIVTMQGQGPGLRVLLKDGSGAVIRQMTGEEFVKLRETVSNDPKARGKILDQKL